MKLYFSPGACSLAPHIVIKELGLNAELIKVDLRTKQFMGGDFLQVNPKGQVPILEVKPGFSLTECGALIQFLSDQSPQKNLMPDVGTEDRYKCLEWINYLATEIHKGFGPLWNPASNEETKTMARQNLMKRFEYLNTKILPNSYLMGGQYTVADAYLFTLLGWTKLVKMDLSEFTNLQSYVGRIAQRPAVQSALKAEGLI